MDNYIVKKICIWAISIIICLLLSSWVWSLNIPDWFKVFIIAFIVGH